MTSDKWYRHSGPEGDVVISTRVRLARNLPQVPFPASMTPEQQDQVLAALRQILAQPPENVAPLLFFDMSDMTGIQAQSMVERHLISPEFAQCGTGSGLLYSEDESLSIMINEEDHVRLQVMRAGLVLDGAFAAADALDTWLDDKLHFAFDDRLGYLTQCPSNLGTGMRASLMLHLPALQERGALQQLANTVSKLGLTIRGLYGEGSKSEGAIYQLSNQVTLGISELAAIENLKGIASQIIRQERAAREAMRQNPHFEDRVWRSLGLLRTARLLSHDEFMTLISNVRVGIATGTLEGPSLDMVGELINDVQPATLMQRIGRELEPAARDAVRAETVRKRLCEGKDG